MRNIKTVLFLLTISAAMSGCGGIFASKNIAPADLEIYAVGDIMAHAPQHKSAQTKNGSYDFNENYDYVRQIIAKADVAICNIEFTFAGFPYAGYPRFSAPDEIAKAVKNAGFNVAVTANNHMFDNGIGGLKRTIEVLQNAGFKTAGSVLNVGDKKYTVIEVKGVSVAVIAATYNSSVASGSVTINGLSVSTEAEKLINHFGYENLDNDLKKYKNYIKQAKSDGANIIVCYFHAGEEYKREPNEFQIEIAKKLAEYGADIIFMSHPHVLQKFEILKYKKRNIPVYYSLGNFISNQRAENLGHRYSEDGMIAAVSLTYNFNKKRIDAVRTEYIPTWVDKYYKDSRFIYSIVPLINDWANNPPITFSGHKNQARQAYEDIISILSSN
ncbi:CapA family protein [Endomicrobium proavitum]|uniref:Capsular polyglutamate synthetase n=1 Tax=Endomicrobium proavitum TaxID=1408281 RepID=A0A0G3WJY2_9BACT|nr:CapA family protein [Endomicrobium proavitum]AKL98187.1 capsular polyglutamate synthetase [Endomicrobium proavitum]